MALERLQAGACPIPELDGGIENEADASSWPSGENTTELTQLEWPSNVCRQVPQSKSTVDIDKYFGGFSKKCIPYYTSSWGEYNRLKSRAGEERCLRRIHS